MGAGLIWTHAAAALLALALGLAGGWQVNGWRLGEQIAAMKAAQDKALISAIEGARVQEQARYKGVQDAQVNATKRAQVAQADASRARTELDGLRDTLRATTGGVSGESATACYQRADRLSVVVAECAKFALEVAGTADQKASDVKTLLEAWPR